MRPLFGNMKLLIAGGVIALAVGYLILAGLRGTTEYFLTVSELQAKAPAIDNQVLRVSGTLVPGTLVKESGGLDIHFLIADPSNAADSLPITYHGGQVPDIMGDNIQIVAEGTLDASGTFTASSVLAKCPSRLENAPPDEHTYTASGASG